MENKFGENTRLYRDVVIRSSVTGEGCVIGDDCFVTDTVLGKKCTLERRNMVFNSTFGDYTNTGVNSVIAFARIGKFVSISWNVSIGGATHNYRALTTHSFPFNGQYGIAPIKAGGGWSRGYTSFKDELTIGNDAWIAANVCVMRGVNISDGAVIGAGAVVTHDVGPYEIWAGVPARKIGQRFSDEIIRELLEMKWWDWPEKLLTENNDMFLDDEVTMDKIKRLKERVKIAKIEHPGGGTLILYLKYNPVYLFHMPHYITVSGFIYYTT